MRVPETGITKSSEFLHLITRPLVPRWDNGMRHEVPKKRNDADKCRSPGWLSRS
ncbi:hypothetical protein EI94DRAFT_1742641 [Lactarius quietus]|nr:hypothetical protein EI94DRAFT_1742641 [Lactarius quietus]